MMKQATIEDIRTLAELAVLLWPHNKVGESQERFKEYIHSGNNVIFLCFEENTPVAFAHCSLRNDYVEGTESSPVGYLEGIFVKPEYQGRGIARKLLVQCEEWTKSKGCTEFASDCELNNIDSLKFHLQVGFKEANRIICFTKQL